MLYLTDQLCYELAEHMEQGSRLCFVMLGSDELKFMGCVFQMLNINVKMLTI